MVYKMGLIKTTAVHESKPLTSNQNATLQIPAYGKIQSMLLQFVDSSGEPVTEAQIRAEIGNIRLTIGGRDVINASASKILDLYETLGVNVSEDAGVAGVMELNVGRLIYTDPAARDILGFGTADVNSIQIQVTAGTLSNIASVEAVTTRQNVNENLGAFCRFINYPQNFNSTGDNTVDTLPRDIKSSYLLAMVDDGASGTITHGEARVNSAVLVERCPLNVNKVILSNDRFKQPSGYFVYAFNDGAFTTNLPMKGVSDFRLVNTFGVAPGASGYNISTLTVENFPSV